MRKNLRRVLERVRGATVGVFRPETSVRGALQEAQRAGLVPAPARSRSR